MKQFIITLSKHDGETEEFRQFSLDLVGVAIQLDNLKLRVRAIEEIPYEEDPGLPAVMQLSHRESRAFQIMQTGEQGCFPGVNTR